MPSQPSPRVRELLKVIEKLEPLHTELGEPVKGDWLDQHYEPGQTFAEYLDSNPTTPRAPRRVIYIQPIGAFSKPQDAIIKATAGALQAYFQLPVKVGNTLPESVVPSSARRRHATLGLEQILTGYVCDNLLLPALPDDTAALIGLAATDLWPGDGWNFVFGQASTEDRVGVWSIHRYGDPAASDAAFRKCLLRTIKTATHEIGHMFSMLHCTAYECNMGGSNSLEESDRAPLALCSQCIAKLCWAIGCDPVARYKQLAAFCRKHDLDAERATYARLAGALFDR
ncbi:MAG: hypothetical protein JSU63_19160 [Phycisphaerales bacterium]|nr:MAG: hypothetical protein JSU63_19160 [Phycisphaerales bacterium]